MELTALVFWDLNTPGIWEKRNSCSWLPQCPSFKRSLSDQAFTNTPRSPISGSYKRAVFWLTALPIRTKAVLAELLVSLSKKARAPARAPRTKAELLAISNKIPQDPPHLLQQCQILSPLPAIKEKLSIKAERQEKDLSFTWESGWMRVAASNFCWSIGFATSCMQSKSHTLGAILNKDLKGHEYVPKWK